MNPLPLDTTDAELIAFADRWAAFMEAEDYEGAYQCTDHIPEMKWTPTLMRAVIKGYGDALPQQKVTVAGQPTDITQRKTVSRWRRNAINEVGEIWCDLNIDGFVSDLTVTFRLVETRHGLVVKLNDIHVM
jgi:hypothetical protein